MRLDRQTRFERHVEMIPEAGCWIWTGSVGKFGYGLFGGSGKGERTQTAHRVAYELFNGPIPSDKVVMHTCDVRCCVNPAHLMLGTNKDNSRDASRKGRLSSGERHWKTLHPEKSPRGASHYRAKLTEEEAFFVRYGPLSLPAVSKRYEISISQAQAIRAGKSWKHLPPICEPGSQPAED